jgi:acetolactate synthase-1/2/3 large subunit
VPDPKAVETARRLLGSARRPAIIAGLQAREPQAAAALRDLVTRWDCAVFTTYKAKGVASDTDPRTIGHYIGGASEEGAIKRADLILLYGFDPVEHPPGKWRYSAPVIELTRHRFERHVVEPTVSLVGDLAGAAEALRSAVAASEWTRRELAELRDDLRRRAEASEGGPIAPQHVVEAAIAAAAPGTRITVDAGAHMLPVLHLWRAEAPSGTLLSRGLSTMGFALPAAIGAALAEPDRPTIAFTGDGGLMMCLGELGTAVQNNSPVVVIVFNDSSLTLIGAKQRRRQLPQAGVDFAPVDFARVARGFGCAGWRVETLDQLRPAIAAAIGERRPAVVDVVVNPAAYHAEIISLRG